MNLIKLSIQRPIFILMITLFFIVLGFLSLRKIPVDLYPDVSYPVLAVRANLDGAAPEEIEEIVTKPLEDVLSSIAGVTALRSSSREGVATVVLEFNSGVDIKFQEMQVRAKVGNIRNSLPDDLSEPVVFRQDPDDTPIIEMAVTGNRTASELSYMAEHDIAERLRQAPGAGEVVLGGERTPEVFIDLNPNAMEAWSLSSAQVIAAIKAFNGNNPIGNLKGESNVWLLRSLSPIKKVEDLEGVPVGKAQDGSVLFLRDVAKVSLGFSEVRRITRLNDGEKLRPAISIELSKQSGENTVAVSDAVLGIIEQLRQDLPPDIQITVTRDNAELVRTNVEDVFETLVIGAILTVVVVLLFLRSPRATLTTGISLPSSIVTTFMIMAIAGFTINVMTLLALSLAIGLLVDDAIVVRENIFRHLQVDGKSGKDASYEGTKEVSLAVIATTLTIVAVFLPVGFMGGTTGQFFSQFAVTVVFAILMSLWDALTMAPMLSAYFANIADPLHEWKVFGAWGVKINEWLVRFEHSFETLEKRYEKILHWILPRSWVAAAIAAGSLLLAGGGFMLIGKSFLPSQLGNVFSAQLNGPMALPIEKINKVAEDVDARVHHVKGVENWTISSGLSGTGNANINLTIRIKKEAAKSQASLAAVRAEVRKVLQGFVGYTPRIMEPSDPLSGSSGRFQPVAVMITGEDSVKLRDLARQVQGIMESVKGITDLAPLQDEGVPELRLKIDQRFAGQFGTSSKDLADELRTWIEGDTTNNIQIGSDRVPIRVRMTDGESLSANSLLARSIFVRGEGGKTSAVPISSATHLEAGAGPSVITRENRQKILRVGANIAQGAALGNIVTDLQAKLTDLPMPKGYKTRIVGQNEQMAELFSNVAIALCLGCIFMYMILASLFESFAQPLTVMAAVPLAATGAILALLVFGLPLDMYGGIGMILLAGIVAKNSILLVDFAIRSVKEHNMEPSEAILKTAPLRLRPIMMTSVAMIVGMIPVATGMGSGGAARQALGVATIGGIISSTLLTLLVVPNLYVAVEKLVVKINRKRISWGLV